MTSDIPTTRSLAVRLLLAVALTWLAGCAEQAMSDRVIAQNEEFCVTGDSVICGDLAVWAVSPQEIDGGVNLNSAELMLQRLAGSDTVPFCLVAGSEARRARGGDYPQFQSQQMLIDALYNLSADDILSNYSQSGGFNDHQDYSSLYGSIYLTLALLNPERAMTTLRNQVAGGYAVQQQGVWPENDDRLGWPIAAWEVFCVTGDRQWLAEAYEVSLNTIDEELDILQDRRNGLLRGGQPSHHAWSDLFPSWAEPADMVDFETLMGNVQAVRAMEVANAMAEELDTDLPYSTEVARLRDATNQSLWSESDGRYSAYLLGGLACPRAPLADNMAQALAVIWDLADDDRSETLIAKTPVEHRGVMPVYPVAGCVEPHLQLASWALVQACWNWAAALAGNEHALRRGLAALYRAQALYQPHHLSIEGRPVNSLSTAAAGMAMIFRVFAGMRFTADGIEFSPHVPACLPGNKTILNLTYRDAVIDITLVGTGNDIALMTLDGEPVEGNYIPATVTGHHNLLIKLRQGKLQDQHVTIATGSRLPPAPAVAWSGDSAAVGSWESELAYRLTVNGMRSYSVTDRAFKLPPTSETTEFSLVAGNRYGFGLPSRSHLQLAEPPVLLALPDSTLAADSVRLEFRAERAGTYLMWAEYTLAGGCDLLHVYANSHAQGVLIAPGRAGQSRTPVIALRLLRGDNVLVLRRYRTGSYATIARVALTQQ